MWLFIGPTDLSGIGQVTKRYAELLGAEYVINGQKCKKSHYEKGFAFILPIDNDLIYPCDTMHYMTVCETRPVNKIYEKLRKYKTIFCPSEFCIKNLSEQFPNIEWKLLRHWSPEVPHKSPSEHVPYTFYTIGNITDPRKNIKSLIDAFRCCNFGGAAQLVLKATCLSEVRVNFPGIIVINGLLTDEALERIHASCHCYVNCSHSEGVGMGAVEAAMRSKPVIITEYGGLKEYVQTPWVISCTEGPVGFDDFLYTRDFLWGHPSQKDLVAHLKDCFEKRVKFWDHSYTKNLMNQVKTQLTSL